MELGLVQREDVRGWEVVVAGGTAVNVGFCVVEIIPREGGEWEVRVVTGEGTVHDFFCVRGGGVQVEEFCF